METRLSKFLFTFVVTFTLIELILFPFREAFVKYLDERLPEGFYATWECTAFDTNALFTAYIISLPSKRSKLNALILGNSIIQLYNGFRIWFVLLNPDPLLHDIVFRAGMVLVTLLLSYAYSVHFGRD